MSDLLEYAQDIFDSLNPCCNGIYSMSALAKIQETAPAVLILVVMEYTQ